MPRFPGKGEHRTLVPGEESSQEMVLVGGLRKTRQEGLAIWGKGRKACVQSTVMHYGSMKEYYVNTH